MFHIGEKITNLRKEKNMTQEELSNLLYVSRQTVSKWESEKIYPDVNNLILISNLFSCSIDYLIIENKNEKCINELDEEHLTFGERIIKLRKINHITQEQLADHLGVSRQALFKWESNKSYPEIDKLIGLSKVFDCSVDYLLRNKEVVKEPNIAVENEINNENVLEKKDSLENNKPINRITAFILDHLFNILFIICMIALRIMLVYTVHAVTLEFYFMRVFLVLPALRFILLSIVYKEKRFLRELQIFVISICLYVPLLISWKLPPFRMLDSRYYYLSCLPIGLAFLYLVKLIGDKKNKIVSIGLFIYFGILASVPFYCRYLYKYYYSWRWEMLGNYLKVVAIIELIIFALIALYKTIKMFLNKCKIKKKIFNVCFALLSFILLIYSTISVFDVNYRYNNGVVVRETASYYIISMIVFSFPLILNLNKKEIKK